MRSHRPGEVVVDEEACCAPSLHPRVVQPSERGERRVGAAALEDDGKRRQRLLKVGWPEQAFVPGERGIEVVHQAPGEHMRVARCEGVERLRRDGVEQRIDRIGIGGLKASVELKPEPGHVLRIDVVVDARRLHLLAIVTRMRNALAVRATVSGGRIAARSAPIAVEWTAENRQRSARGVAVQRKELLVKRHELRRRLIGRAGYGVHSTARKLLQDVVLKCRRRHGRGTDDRQRDPDPFGIEEEEQLVVENRAAQTAAEVIHRGARLVISGGRVRKEIRRIELRAVPQLVQVPVKPVGPGFRDIVDLRSAIPALIDRVGERVDRHLRDRIQSKHQIGRKAAVQIGQRIVGFQSIDDIAVGERRQAIELHVAITIRAADEVVAAARGVDERASGKLQRVSHVATRIRQVFNGSGGQGRRGIGILRVDQRRLLLHQDAFAGGCDVELEIDRLLLPETGGDGVVLLWLKAVCFRLHRVRPGLELRKAEPPGVVGFHGSFQAILDVRDGHGRAGDRRAGRIGDRPDDRARRLALSQRRNPHRQSEDDEDGQAEGHRFRHA